MYTIALVNFIAVAFLGIANAWTKNRSLIFAVTVMLILFFGIRVDYGNDYAQYELMFRHVNSIGNGAVMRQYVRVEIGWVWLCALFGKFDFSVLVFFLTVVQFGTVGWFINKYVPANIQWAVLALYLFWPSLMIMGLSQMRQTLAMSIVLMAIPSILNRRWIPSIVIILVATLFHTSAFVAFLFLIVTYLYKINYKWGLTIFLLLIVTETVFRDSYFMMALQVLESTQFKKYKIYAQGVNDMRSGLGYIMQLMFALYMVWITRWKSVDRRFFIYSLVIYYAMTPLTSVLGSIVRLAYYFQLVGIIAFPVLLRRMRRDAAAMAFGVLFIFLVFYNFVYFFEDPTWVRAFKHYNTIFGQLS